MWARFAWRLTNCADVCWHQKRISRGHRNDQGYGRHPGNASICRITYAVLWAVRIFNFGNGNYRWCPSGIFRRLCALGYIRPYLQMAADIAVA
jgi:hypothetical protein